MASVRPRAYAGAAMRAHAHHRYTWDEYMALEQASPVKHEYFDGEIFAMARGTPEHSQLSVRVTAELSAQLRGTPCVPYNSDLRVRVLATGLTTYPDASVVCGPLEYDPEDRNKHTVTNAAVVIEVLSPSTEEYDRGDKFTSFRRMPSLRHYVLVSYREPLIEVFSRTSADEWTRLEARTGASVGLPAIGCTLRVDAIFEGVPLR